MSNTKAASIGTGKRNLRRLSDRLTRIAEWVPAGSRFCDVGTDHAWLPVHLATAVAVAVGTDTRARPLSAAATRAGAHGVELRCGSGLSAVRPYEFDVISIAGIGGVRIASILEQGQERLAGVRRLILQPMRGERPLRAWLRGCGFGLRHETIFAAAGHVYEILVADRDAGDRAYRSSPLDLDASLAAGPLLLRDANPLLLAKWRRRRDHFAREAARSPGRPRQIELDARRAERVVRFLAATCRVGGVGPSPRASRPS